MSDEWIVDTEAKLVETLGEPIPGLAEKVDDHLDAMSLDYVAHAPLVLVTTIDKQGRMDVSPKGDAPGFCVAENGRQLLIPDRPGNKLAFGFRNIIETGRIGLIFLMPTIRETLRINGSAEISREPALLERMSANGKPAILVTKVQVEECFFHCGKAMIRSKLWKPESWVTPPDINFGRQYREKAAKEGASKEEAHKLGETVEELIAADYADNLY
jgi:hypothetical protein